MKPLDANTITRIARIQLEAKGIWIWRNNQLRVPGRKFMGEPGCADLIGMDEKGVFVACEVKAKGDFLSDDQEKFLICVKRRGGKAVVAIEGVGGNVLLVDIEEYLKM